MDLLPSVDELRDHLHKHDRAIQAIMALDGYIETMCEQTFLSTMDDYLTPAFQKMIRIHVAEGMKRMYKEYRLQKWLKVQEMAATVRRVLESDLDVSEEALPEDQGQIMTVGQVPVPAVYQLQPQEANDNWQLAAPQAYNWYPVTDNWQRSPMAPQVLSLVSPLSTPLRADDNDSRRNIVDASTPSYGEQRLQTMPGQFSAHTTSHQLAADNSQQLINRQLFPDNIPVTQNVQWEPATSSSECRDSGTSTSVPSVLEDLTAPREEVQHLLTVNIVDQSVFVNGYHNAQEMNVEFEMNHDNQRFVNREQNIQAIENQSEEMRHTMMQHYQQQQQNINENADDPDEQMDWDTDSSYDESDEGLASVLFATQLLPDEQSIRLDVEMGDMGIGHILFDRVSATWYTSHSEFYRGD